MFLDEKDKKILSILLNASGTTKAEIARRVGLAASAVSERIKKIEDEGIIKSYEARLDTKALNYNLLTFVHISEIKPKTGFDTAAALSKVTGVEEVHKIAGNDCYIVKLRVKDTDHLNTILNNEIDVIETINGVNTTIVLNTILEKPPLSQYTL